MHLIVYRCVVWVGDVVQGSVNRQVKWPAHRASEGVIHIQQELRDKKQSISSDILNKTTPTEDHQNHGNGVLHLSDTETLRCEFWWTSEEPKTVGHSSAQLVCACVWVCVILWWLPVCCFQWGDTRWCWGSHRRHVARQSHWEMPASYWPTPTAQNKAMWSKRWEFDR